MNAKSLLAILAFIMFSVAASAQGYHIRIAKNTNLRAGYSLESSIVETARAGSTLQVIGQHNRWLKINRNGKQVWMTNWVSHSRVAAPAQAPPAAAQQPANVDNCCFVDRECHTDEEWMAGYWAYQQNTCPPPALPHIDYQALSLTRTGIPAEETGGLITDLGHAIDNCCDLDRECHTEAEWRDGYNAFSRLECWDEYHKWARTPDPRYMPAEGSDNCCTAPGWLCLNDTHYQRGFDAFLTYSHCRPHIMRHFIPSHEYYDAVDNCCQLDRECLTDADWQRGYHDWSFFRCEFSVPLIDQLPVRIEGSDEFYSLYRVIFSLLKARSPYYYDYVARGSQRIVQRPEGHYALCTSPRNNTHESPWHSYDEGPRWHAVLRQLWRTVHEACHCNRQWAGLDEGLPSEAFEAACMEPQHFALLQVDPGDSSGIARDFAIQIYHFMHHRPQWKHIFETPLSYWKRIAEVGL